MSSKGDISPDTVVLSVRVRKAVRWHLNRAAKAAGLKQADYLRQTIEKAVKPQKRDIEPLTQGVSE